MARDPLPENLRTGPFSVSRARRHGVGRRRLQGSDLARPFHGVRTTHVSGSAAHTDRARERCRALATVMPEGAAFCGVTAALLWRLPLPYWAEREPVHVVMPAPGRGLRSAGVVGHKFQIDPEDATQLSGVRVTTRERTWCDLATQLPLDHLVAAGDALFFRMPDGERQAAVALLRDTVARHRGRRGRGRMRQALELLDPASESPQESRLRVILGLAGIGGLVANHPTIVAGRQRRIDLALPGPKVAFEYQGTYHLDAAQWRADLKRRSQLEAAGWTVVFLGADDLDDPTELVQRLRRIIARAERTSR